MSLSKSRGITALPPLLPLSSSFNEASSKFGFLSYSWDPPGSHYYCCIMAWLCSIMGSQYYHSTLHSHAVWKWWAAAVPNARNFPAKMWTLLATLFKKWKSMVKMRTIFQAVERECKNVKKKGLKVGVSRVCQRVMSRNLSIKKLKFLFFAKKGAGRQGLLCTDKINETFFALL